MSFHITESFVLFGQCAVIIQVKTSAPDIGISGKCCKRIEELGMNHKEACELVSSIMNLGIAIQEKH